MVKRPLRVLQIFHGLGMGGAETWLLALLRHWQDRKRAGDHAVETVVLLTGGVREVHDNEAAALGARLIYFPYKRSRLGEFVVFLRKLLHEGNFDAIHAHGDYLAGWQFLMGLGELPGVRVVHVHNCLLHLTVDYAVSPVRVLVTKVGKGLVNGLATHVCGTSAQILQEYGFRSGKGGRPEVLVAHCGFSINEFIQSRHTDAKEVRMEFGWPREARIILSVGRLDRSMELDHPQNQKNSGFALHVVKRVAERDGRVCFIMAGAGEESRRRLEKEVEKWGLSRRIRLVGVRHDIARLMRAADLLLFPSRQEGLGMVAVEAQAAGLPVLASGTVPRECVVIPGMCFFLPLEVGIDVWAGEVRRIMCQSKPPVEDCRRRLEQSPFAIENSARLLEQVYSGNRK